MKRFLSAFFLFGIYSFTAAGNVPLSKTYYFSVDLTQVMDDKLMVSLLTPSISNEEAIYRIPKIVPGTYEVYNFGRFISDFKAFDKSNNPLTAEKLDDNSWKIKNATQLYKITYWVEDTWDTQIKESFVFEPAGTNIEANKNFVINTHAFFGYFDEMKDFPYQLEVTHPEKFYGSTGLSNVKNNGNVDTYSVSDYMQLADAPIMYDIPDTSVLNVGGAKVLVSVYSPNKAVTSKFVAENIETILKAQKQYLGGKLPIQKYAFIIYLTDKMSGSGANGALEHSYSSFYFLPEIAPEALAQTMKDVAAHEFFHIVTPLSIHAEQIGNFDFNNPSMSEHLWLYEGCTEYFASNVQVKNGLMSTKDYLEVLRSKMTNAEEFNDTLPFTEMSLGCLDKYRNQYGNVYEKGALIGMCLDIKLLNLSAGKYRLEDLLTDLSKTYGKEKSFRDEELFQQIVKLTYPEIGNFLNTCVSGHSHLPIKETLALVGIDFKEQERTREISLGGIGIGFNQKTQHLVVFDVSDMNAFGKKMGYKVGDEIISFNKKVLTADNVKDVISGYMSNAKEGDKLQLVVLRKSEKGKEKKTKLKGKVIAIEKTRKYILSINPTPSDKQMVIRKAWLLPN